MTGVILATYCAQYQHAVPFLRNKMLYPLLKPPKAHAFFFRGGGIVWHRYQKIVLSFLSRAEVTVL